jgi:hypothetical protein
MSFEIHGWVETRELQGFEPWDATIWIYGLVSVRNYAMFASLFGVRNSSDDFEPSRLVGASLLGHHAGIWKSVLHGRVMFSTRHGCCGASLPQ